MAKISAPLQEKKSLQASFGNSGYFNLETIKKDKKQKQKTSYFCMGLARIRDLKSN